MSNGTNGRGGIVFWGAVAAALTVLIGLGTWQMQRREWKFGLIERIQQRAHGEPVSLTLAKELWQTKHDVEYYRVLLVGHFLHDQERYLFTVEDGTPGWRVVTPLVTSGGDIVLVDRGFVPEALRDPATRKKGQIGGTVELIGLARAPARRAWFTPAGDPKRNQWFARDVGGMAASLPDDEGTRVVPFLVEAEAENVPGGWPHGGVTRLTLPNRHLEYALTWYGLALSLIVVAIVLTRTRSREAARQL